jgi:hypothetical protein
MNPVLGFALAPAAEASLEHGQRGRLHGGQHKPQAILRSRQGTMMVHATRARSPGGAIEAPCGHRRLERRRTGQDEELKRGERQAGASKALWWARLQIGAP